MAPVSSTDLSDTSFYLTLGLQVMASRARDVHLPEIAQALARLWRFVPNAPRHAPPWRALVARCVGDKPIARGVTARSLDKETGSPKCCSACRMPRVGSLEYSRS